MTPCRGVRGRFFSRSAQVDEPNGSCQKPANVTIRNIHSALTEPGARLVLTTIGPGRGQGGPECYGEPEKWPKFKMGLADLPYANRKRRCSAARLLDYEPGLDGLGHRLGAVGDIELAQDVLDVVFYGERAQFEYLANLLVGHAIADKGDYLGFAYAKPDPLPDPAADGILFRQEHAMQRGVQVGHQHFGEIGVTPSGCFRHPQQDKKTGTGTRKLPGTMRHGMAKPKAGQHLGNGAGAYLFVFGIEQEGSLATVAPGIGHPFDQVVQIVALQAPVFSRIGARQNFATKSRGSIFSIPEYQQAMREKTLQHSLRPEKKLVTPMDLLGGFDGNQESFEFDSAQGNNIVHRQRGQRSLTGQASRPAPWSTRMLSASA